jgi:GNAT superfamily N-acetyltransferase
LIYHEPMKNSKATFIPYDGRFLNEFVELNREWIETYFKLEPSDLRQLQNSKDAILDPGGEIFFLIDEGTVVGTVAMIPHGEHGYELAKMAVKKSTRGKGYGDQLMEGAIAWARQKHAKEVTLLSNTILEPAIRLYKKHGFQVVNLGPHPDYERCNIEMKLELRD